MTADEMKLYEITHCFGLKKYYVQFWREKNELVFFSYCLFTCVYVTKHCMCASPSFLRELGTRTHLAGNKTDIYVSNVILRIWTSYVGHILSRNFAKDPFLLRKLLLFVSACNGVWALFLAD
jgi:hypothetical protein